MICRPPPACQGRLYQSSDCTPPSECSDNGDGTFTCRFPAGMGPGGPRRGPPPGPYGDGGGFGGPGDCFECGPGPGDDHSARMEAVRGEVDAAVEAVLAEYRAALLGLRAEYRDGVQSLRDEYDTEKDRLRAEYDACLAGVGDDDGRGRGVCVQAARDGLEDLRRHVRDSLADLRSDLLDRADDHRFDACTGLEERIYSVLDENDLFDMPIGAVLRPEHHRFCGDLLLDTGFGGPTPGWGG